METSEFARDLSRARRRAALRERKMRVERDFVQYHDWFRAMEPGKRARQIGHYARTPAACACPNHSNPRRRGPGAASLSVGELRHLHFTRVDLQEIRREFAIVTLRRSIRTGGR